MPGRGTDRHTLRLDDRIWDRFGEATEQAGTDRAAVQRQMIAWYLGEGELPVRPVDVQPDD